ncbi:DUF4142 domain-containing protein [Rhodoplanes roseus]|uniref:DUF4142 domain-containing protein n=1 Tax=Rhodoplanes roseus TaxID=29409 RepID=A0A327L1G3_9BRAD|nr:DUF4142 domain-containing protein [Rhodoplanes roseus]RAI43312.1 hypothetical protein CH341_14965 [Rhodoplanes roseus]
MFVVPTRKILLLTSALALAAGPAVAQQLGNPPGPGPVAPSTGVQPATPSGSQTTGAAPASGVNAVPTADFVKKVAISDMFEIQSSQLAREKADREGRDFANKMIQAHTKTSNELKAMVQGGKIQAEVPTGLDQEHAQKLERLRGLSGDAFEDAYAEIQVQAHKDAVALFTAYAQNGDNPELKQWASKTLPELKQHLDMADDLD